ncbi:MAG: ATP-binding protein [Ignavibacteriales bacterium]|nr:ATP-binding protein [Ignavibacteriales bacterium]
MWRCRICLIAGMSLLLLSTSSAVPSTTKSILILNSYHYGYSWSDEEVNGILESFSAARIPIDPMIEYLDCKHFPTYEHFEAAKNLLKTKLSLVPVSIVFVLDNPALDFAVRFRDQLFPGIPIVFMGINGYRPEMVTGIQQITGVAEYLDIIGTVSLALALQPEIRNIVVLHDYTSTGLSTRREAEERLRGLNSGIHVRYLPPLSIGQILDTVRRLSDGTILLSLSFSRDNSGELFNHPDISRILAKASSVPVYAVHGERMGFGAVGGSVLGGRPHAMRAAELALRILAGEHASLIPVVVNNPYRLVLDYNALERYGLTNQRLPAGVVLINRPPGFYEVHRTVINTAAVIILFLALAIFVQRMNIIRRNKAEEALRESEAQLHRAQSIAHIGSWHFDGRSGLFDSSTEMCRLLGYPADAHLFLKDFLATVVEEDRPMVDSAFRSALNEGMPMGVEYRALPAGESGLRHLRTVAESIARDNVYDVFGTTQDVTDRRFAETERGALLVQLAQKNQDLENVVYVTSHDLRSPIINILGFGEQLARSFREFSQLLQTLLPPDAFKTKTLPTLTDDIETSLRFIQSSGKKMDSLISGLLRFSRSGRIDLHAEYINMNQLLENVVDSLKYQIENAHASIIAGNLPPCHGDSGQINQVFSNLIDNALKYAASERHPVITIGASFHRESIVYSVEDNGIGIAAEHRQKVWELFHRLNPRGIIQGEGLGLPLVKKIVERHNGTVWVESQEGVGSKFFIELPAAEARSPQT